ncbi:probable tRNA (guanine(26)-N(2))-dimethyltransferase 2 [Tanacetum coccineum]
MVGVTLLAKNAVGRWSMLCLKVLRQALLGIESRLIHVKFMELFKCIIKIIDDLSFAPLVVFDTTFIKLCGKSVWEIMKKHPGQDTYTYYPKEEMYVMVRKSGGSNDNDNKRILIDLYDYEEKEDEESSKPKKQLVEVKRREGLYPFCIPDLYGGLLVVSGRYNGKFPKIVKARGIMADMSTRVIDVKVKNAKSILLDKVCARWEIDSLLEYSGIKVIRRFHEGDYLDVKTKFHDVPLFLSLHNLCATLKRTFPSAVIFRCAMINAEYRISGTHVNPLGLKSNAPIVILSITFLITMMNKKPKSPKQSVSRQKNRLPFLVKKNNWELDGAIIRLAIWKRIFNKRTKGKPKTTKPSGMQKTRSNQGQSQSKSKSQQENQPRQSQKIAKWRKYNLRD